MFVPGLGKLRLGKTKKALFLDTFPKIDQNQENNVHLLEIA